MSSWPEDIAAMHKKYGFDKIPFEDLNRNFLNFRAKFLQEELNEIYEAIDDNNSDEVVDGLIDLCVVAIGTLTLFKVDAQRAWDEVHKWNLRKKRGIKKGREESDGWDLVKDEDWLGPNHSGNFGLLRDALDPLPKDTTVQTEMFVDYVSDPPQDEKQDSSPVTFAMKVLDHCVELQKKKGQDYQNPNSSIRQADHYPRGVNTIYDMVHQKMIRIKSLLETAESNGTTDPNQFESIADSAVDAINYLSFMVSYLEGTMEGQDANRDMFNKRRK